MGSVFCTQLIFKICPYLLNGGIHKDRPSAMQFAALTLSATLHSSHSSCFMAEFRVECLTLAHIRTRLIPSLTFPGYSLSPPEKLIVRRLVPLCSIAPHVDRYLYNMNTAFLLQMSSQSVNDETSEAEMDRILEGKPYNRLFCHSTVSGARAGPVLRVRGGGGPGGGEPVNTPLLTRAA